MRYALFIPLFGELAEPTVAVELAIAAEQHGWDGMFVWDHLLWDPPVRVVADPWVVMSAMAQATERIVLGPMVTPIARRRPHILARQTVTLDRLSQGRLVLGVGLGGDRGGELTHFGEELDPRARADLLDRGLEEITRWWAGDEVRGVRFLPPPVQVPRIPVWVASRYPHLRPVRRAAQWDGWFPVDVPSPEALAEQIAYAAAHRPAGAASWEVAMQGRPDTDPTPWAAAGATWWLVRFEPWAPTAAEVLAVIDAGPPPA